MDLCNIQLNLVLVFFVYGLAFFSMGITLTLEMGRSSRLDETRVLLPLALFGLMHGTHEWLEIFIVQMSWFEAPFPVWVEWGRVGWLTLSFIPLVVYGLLGLSTGKAIKGLELYGSAVLLSLCMIVASLTIHFEIVVGDVFARYFLAVPGGILAGLAMFRRSRQLKDQGNLVLGKRFMWSGAGFIVYGLSQVFTPAAAVSPASLINADVFQATFGVPIQVVRAAAAVVITLNLLRAIKYVERIREEQLWSAQRERLEAMEQVQEELVNREAMRRELLRHIVIAQEEERSRIARELHDETAQVLTAFSLNLATLRGEVTKKKDAIERIDQLQILSRQMSKGIYHLVHDLRPSQLDDLGLGAALQHLCDEFRHRCGLVVTLEIEGQKQRLDPLVETVLFRVAQEALTNIQRHACTKRATMTLQFDTYNVTLQVSDQGVGFNPNQELIPPHGWGLAGMRERTESVGGHLEIHSEIGIGSQVKIIIPITIGTPSQIEEAGNGRN